MPNPARLIHDSTRTGGPAASMLPSGPMHDTESRIARVRGRVAEAAARAGRPAGEVQILAVSKTRPPEVVQAAIAAGVRDLGENRVQEAERKIPLVLGAPTWHLIGGLQSNKAARAACLFDVIHSVDRPKLVPRLDQAAAAAGRRLEIYVQVEFSRTELSPPQIEARARHVAADVAAAGALELAGLMTLPPFDPDPEAARPWFRKLRAIRDAIECEGILAPGLSMGMSNDFEIAIEEGATIVRIGTTIFGPRPRVAEPL